MNLANNRIRAALLNRDLTHSAFRLYMALEQLLADREPEYAITLSVPKLKALLPGVKGKEFGEGPLRDALRDLQDAGLIEVFGAHWSKIYIQVSLLSPQADSAINSAFADIPMKSQSASS